MKQRFYKALILCMVSALLFTGCKSKKETVSLSGEYRLTAMEKDGLAMSAGKEALSFLSALDDTITLRLLEDGSGTMTVSVMEEQRETKTLRWDSKTIKEDSGESWKWSLEGNELKMEAKDGRILVFTRQG